MPYRTLDDRIDGVVITFADITVAKTLEAKLRASTRLWKSASRRWQSAATPETVKRPHHAKEAAIISQGRPTA
jgi:hypothetical protein